MKRSIWEKKKNNQTKRQKSNKAKKTYASEGVESQYPPEDLFVHPEEWIKDCKEKSILLLERTDQLEINNQISFKQSPQPAFYKKFDLLIKYLNKNKEKGYKNIKRSCIQTFNISL